MNKLKASVLSLSLLTVMAGAAVAPALGTISAHFQDVPQTMIKLIITLPALLIIITSALFSFLIARFSPKSITIAGLLLYILGGGLAGFVDNIYLILCFRVLLGIGVGLIMPLSTGFLTMLFDKKEQSKLMGYSSAMNNLGGIIATSLSGVLVAINWRFSFWIYFLGLIVLILIIKNLPDVSFHESSKDSEKHSSLDKEELRAILPYAFAAFLVMLVFYALPSNFSMIVSKTGLFPIALMGVVLSVQNIIAFIAGMGLSGILKSMGKRTPHVSSVILAVGFLLMSLSANVLATLAGLVFIGFGLGVLIPILNSQIAMKISREKAASAMSVMSVFLFLGQFLSPIILDSLSGVMQINVIEAPYYFAAAISVILFVFLIFLPLHVDPSENA